MLEGQYRTSLLRASEKAQKLENEVKGLILEFNAGPLKYTSDAKSKAESIIIPEKILMWDSKSEGTKFQRWLQPLRARQNEIISNLSYIDGVMNTLEKEGHIYKSKSKLKDIFLETQILIKNQKDELEHDPPFLKSFQIANKILKRLNDAQKSLDGVKKLLIESDIIPRLKDITKDMLETTVPEMQALLEKLPSSKVKPLGDHIALIQKSISDLSRAHETALLTIERETKRILTSKSFINIVINDSKLGNQDSQSIIETTDNSSSRLEGAQKDAESYLSRIISERLDEGVDKATNLPKIGKNLKSLIRIYTVKPPPSMNETSTTTTQDAQSFWTKSLSPLDQDSSVELVSHVLHPFTPIPGFVVINPDNEDLVISLLWTLSGFVRAHGVGSTVLMVRSKEEKEFVQKVLEDTQADMNVQQVVTGIGELVESSADMLVKLKANYKIHIGKVPTSKTRFVFYLWPMLSSFAPGPTEKDKHTFIFTNSFSPGESSVAFNLISKLHHETLTQPHIKNGNVITARSRQIFMMGIANRFINIETKFAQDTERKNILNYEVKVPQTVKSSVLQISKNKASTFCQVLRQIIPQEDKDKDYIVKGIASTVQSVQQKQMQTSQNGVQAIYVGSSTPKLKCSEASQDLAEYVYTFLREKLGFSDPGSGVETGRGIAIIRSIDEWNTKAEPFLGRSLGVVIILRQGNPMWTRVLEKRIQVVHWVLPLIDKTERERVVYQINAPLSVKYDWPQEVTIPMELKLQPNILNEDFFRKSVARYAINKYL